MFSLFGIDTNTNLLPRINQDWLNVEKGLKHNLDMVVNFYHRHSLAMHGNHFLVSLMMNVNISMSMDLDRYYANLQQRCKDLSRTVGLTSSTNMGRIFNGVFYAEDNDELIISLEEDFNYESALRDWANIRAVECLRNPHSNTALLLPTGRKNSTGFGIGITTVNIPLLMIQYRGFREHEAQLVKTIPDYQQRSIMQFVHMYVLPNMLPSMFDECLFNRLFNLTFGIPQDEPTRRHSFYISNWNKRLNEVQGRVIKACSEGNMNMSTVLRNVPLLTQQNLLQGVQLPDMVQTRQVLWVLLISRMRQIAWLLEMRKRNGNTEDESTISNLKRFFIRMRYNQPLAIPSGGNKHLKMLLEEELEMLYTLLEI